MLNAAELIIAGILCLMLFIFLLLGIILLVKLIKISNEVNGVIETAREISDKTNDVMDSVRKVSAMGSVTNLIKLAIKKYNETKADLDDVPEAKTKGKK